VVVVLEAGGPPGENSSWLHCADDLDQTASWDATDAAGIHCRGSANIGVLQRDSIDNLAVIQTPKQLCGVRDWQNMRFRFSEEIGIMEGYRWTINSRRDRQRKGRGKARGWRTTYQKNSAYDRHKEKKTI
jgi:hypothetical protein